MVRTLLVSVRDAWESVVELNQNCITSPKSYKYLSTFTSVSAPNVWVRLRLYAVVLRPSLMWFSQKSLVMEAEVRATSVSACVTY